MSSVVCRQFVRSILEVEIDRCLSDGQLIGNLLIAMAIADELEHLQLAGGKIVFAAVP